MQTQVEIEFGRWAENKHNELNEDGMLEGQGQLQVCCFMFLFSLEDQELYHTPTTALHILQRVVNIS